MSTLFDDPDWPRAHRWLAGERAHPPVEAAHTLRVLGLPLMRGSITPSRCDLAPAAIREALQRYTPYDILHRRSLSALRTEDAGDLDVSAMDIEAATAPARDGVAAALRGTDALVLLGGDNSISRPGCLGMAASGHDLRRCALLTLDAHLDLRRLNEGLNNGNPVRALLADGLPGANIVQIGIQSFANSENYLRAAHEAGIMIVPVELAAARGIEPVVSEALTRLAGRADAIYFDLDLDVLDRCFAPATAGARPGGLTPLDLRRAAYLCGAHPKVRIMDLVEIDPTRDLNDVTSLAAAACLLSFASGMMTRPDHGAAHAR